MRSTYVPKKLFLQVMKDVRAEAEALGVRFVYRSVPIGFTEDGLRVGTHGTYDPRVKTIRITSRGHNGRAQILFVAFHELRHAQHHSEGLYPLYYTGSWCHDPWEALAAEQDCNDYSLRRLENLHINLENVSRMYPFWLCNVEWNKKFSLISELNRIVQDGKAREELEEIARATRFQAQVTWYSALFKQFKGWVFG